MASAITITVGTATATFVPKADDQKVGKTFNDFYRAYNLGPMTATTDEKLMAVCKWFAKFAHDRAVLQYHDDQAPVNQSEADAIYGVPEP